MVQYVSRNSDMDREEYLNPFIASKRNKLRFAIGGVLFYVFGFFSILIGTTSKSAVGWTIAGILMIPCLIGMYLIFRAKLSDWWHRGDI